MAKTDIAEMNIKLQFDGKSLSASQSTIEKETKNWGSNLGNIAKTAGKTIAAGLAAGVTGVTALAKSAVNAYADYEQLAGGVETLFKESQDTIFQYSQEAYKTAGLSANQYMETVTSFSASLLQGLNGDTAAAAEISNQAVIDMADNANKMGTDIGRIQDAYQGFAKQNYTMLDNLKLGYGGTASEMARLINDSGVLGKSVKVTAQTVNDVSFDKMIQAIHVVQDNLGITGTTAKEASTTISGSLNSMKASWGNLLAFFGGGTAMAWEDIFPAFVDSVKTFASNVIPVVQDVLFGITALIKDLAPEIIKALPELIREVVPVLIGAAVNIVQALATALPEIISGLIEAVVAAIPQLVDALVAAVPAIIEGLLQIAMLVIQQLPTILTSIVDGIMQIVTILTQPQYLQMILQAGLQLLLKLVEAIPQVIVAIINALPDIVSNIILFLRDPANLMMIIDATVQLFFGIVAAVPQILSALLGAFGTLVGNLWEGVRKMFGEFASNFGNFIGNIFKNAINGVISFIENFINTPINVLNGFIDIINGAFGWIGVNLGKINKVQLPRLAEGGYADGATAAIFGEAGAEVALPLENNTGNWAGLLATTLAAEMRDQELVDEETRPIVVNFYDTTVRNNDDIQRITQGISQVMRRAA